MSGAERLSLFRCIHLPSWPSRHKVQATHPWLWKEVSSCKTHGDTVAKMLFSVWMTDPHVQHPHLLFPGKLKHCLPLHWVTRTDSQPSSRSSPRGPSTRIRHLQRDTNVRNVCPASATDVSSGQLRTLQPWPKDHHLLQSTVCTSSTAASTMPHLLISNVCQWRQWICSCMSQISRKWSQNVQKGDAKASNKSSPKKEFFWW